MKKISKTERSPEIIEKSGKRFVVMPEAFYEKLVDDAEMLEDIQAYKAAKARNEESFPAEFVYKKLECRSVGERIQVWREYRGLSKAALGKAIGKNGQYISMIEAGKRTGTIATISDIAKALQCDMDDIV